MPQAAQGLMWLARRSSGRARVRLAHRLPGAWTQRSLCDRQPQCLGEQIRPAVPAHPRARHGCDPALHHRRLHPLTVPLTPHVRVRSPPVSSGRAIGPPRARCADPLRPCAGYPPRWLSSSTGAPATQRSRLQAIELPRARVLWKVQRTTSESSPPFGRFEYHIWYTGPRDLGRCYPRAQARRLVRGESKGVTSPFQASDEARGIVTVPHPKKDIPVGTLASIERQAGVRLR